ncbi:MAG: ABC transporter permease subunit [Thermaerobacter sp.]|nr:ABC transporter permease subunit [Thermaerobacter sp.]
MSRKDYAESGPRSLVMAVTGLFVVVGLSLLAALFVGAWPLLRQSRLLANLLGSTWNPLSGQLGLTPFFVGTVTVTALGLAVAIPVSLGVGISVARQLRGGIKELAVRVLTVLTAVPSVVFGWWGLQVVVPWVRVHFGGSGYSLLTGGLVLGVMLIPTTSLLFYQVIDQVPPRYQQGSLALGATQDQTLIRVVLPFALPGLIHGLLVAVARGVGETIAVQMVIGGQTYLPSGLTSSGATLTTQLLTDLSVFPPGTQGHAVLDVMALILMVGMYLLVRATARWGLER